MHRPPQRRTRNRIRKAASERQASRGGNAQHCTQSTLQARQGRAGFPTKVGKAKAINAIRWPSAMERTSTSKNNMYEERPKTNTLYGREGIDTTLSSDRIGIALAEKHCCKLRKATWTTHGSSDKQWPQFNNQASTRYTVHQYLSNI